MSVTSELELLIEKVRSLEETLIARTRELVAATEEIAALKAAAAAPADGSFRLVLRPTITPDACWKPDTSDSRNTITKLADRWRCKAGGYSGASSVYARWRAFLPEFHDRAPRKAFTLSCTWEITVPIVEYVRILGTDNYLGKMKGTGASVGTLSGDEWRVMLVYYSDGTLRLMSVHQNFGVGLTLWQSAGRFPLGRHSASIEFTPSTTSGFWKLTLDGTVHTKTGVPTVPSTVPLAERVVTRLIAGADGANKWTTAPVTLDVLDVGFSAIP